MIILNLLLCIKLTVRLSMWMNNMILWKFWIFNSINLCITQWWLQSFLFWLFFIWLKQIITLLWLKLGRLRSFNYIRFWLLLRLSFLYFRFWFIFVTLFRLALFLIILFILFFDTIFFIRLKYRFWVLYIGRFLIRNFIWLIWFRYYSRYFIFVFFHQCDIRWLKLWSFNCLLFCIIVVGSLNVFIISK